MIRETIVPSIPDIRSDNTLEVLRAIKATLDVREGSVGDPLDQLVTMRELAALNVVDASSTTTTASGSTIPVGAVLPSAVDGYIPSVDYTPPPQPTGLRAKGGFTNVFLSWDGAPYRNHSYTEIWRAQADVLGDAVMVGTTAASVYADAAQEDTTYYYWIRFVSQANVTGAYNQTSGTQARTAINIASVAAILSSEITGSQLFVDLGLRINRIETDAYIKNLTSGAYKSSLDRISADLDSVNSEISYVRAVTSNQATQLNVLSSRASNDSRVFFETIAPVSTASYTLKVNDLWYDTNDGNRSYRWDGSKWVLFSNAAKVYYQTTAPVWSVSSPISVNDLWYDSDDNNKPYIYKINEFGNLTWVPIRDGYIDATITTLEQTKIGYATFNANYNHNGTFYPTGSVFDNAGAIVDKSGVDVWNASHLTDQSGRLTWNVGLPLASAVKQVMVGDGTSNLTLEQRFTAQKKVNGDLSGQYTVKIDNNGHVSGFGLASETVNGAIASAFIIRADRFALASPNDTTNPLGTVTPTTVSTPFMVFTTPTEINLGGKKKTYPAGTWINSAFIANATIDTAQIRDLTADKITTGTMTATVGISTGKLYGGVAVNAENGNLTQAFAGTNFGTGFYLGDDAGTYKFYVGSPTQNVNWNGTTLAVSGTVTATAGSIGGVTIESNAIRSGQTAFNTGSGFYLGADGKFSVGNSQGNRVTWDGSTLNLSGKIVAGSAAQGGEVQLGPDVVSAGHHGLSLSGTNYNNIFLRRASDGVVFFRLNDGGTNSITFDSNSGLLNVKGRLSASQVSVGTASDATTFFDPQNADIALRSTATGYLSYYGDPKITTAVQSTCQYQNSPDDGPYYAPCTVYTFTAVPVTSDAVTFYCMTDTREANAPIARRIRTGAVRFTVICTATVDHYLSIFYRIVYPTFVGGWVSGDWVSLGSAVEPQGDYGTASVASTFEISVGAGNKIQFAMCSTDGAFKFLNVGKTELRWAHLTVTAINF